MPISCTRYSNHQELKSSNFSYGLYLRKPKQFKVLSWGLMVLKALKHVVEAPYMQPKTAFNRILYSPDTGFNVDPT